MTYAELLKVNNKADTPASGATQQSGRPQTPSQPAAAAPTAASAQPASPAPAPALPPRASGNRHQGRHGPTAAAAPAAGSDLSGKGDQRGAAAHGASADKPAGNNASANGPPARPPYSAPGRGPAQGYRDDESSKKAVFVRNVPQASLDKPAACLRCPKHHDSRRDFVFYHCVSGGIRNSSCSTMIACGNFVSFSTRNLLLLTWVLVHTWSFNQVLECRDHTSERTLQFPLYLPD